MSDATMTAYGRPPVAGVGDRSVRVLVDDEAVRAHLAAALVADGRRCRRDGVPMPPAIAALLAALAASTAWRGQSRRDRRRPVRMLA